MGGQTFKAPDGFTVKMDEKNHHLHKPVFIGEVKADGQFNVVWKTQGPDQGAAVEPVHRRQRQEEGRAGQEVTARRREDRAGDPARMPGSRGCADCCVRRVSRVVRRIAIR